MYCRSRGKSSTLNTIQTAAINAFDHPMEIKILCQCGAKYKFDVEPINGQLPAPVQCPVCHADGTSAANALIAEKLAALPRAVPVPVPTPAVVVASSIRLGAAAPVESPVPMPQAPPAISPPKKRQKEYTGPSNMRGIIGAAVAGLVGMILWAVLIIATNREIGWVAWGVGGLVGFGAKTFGKGESDQIGLAASRPRSPRS